MDYRRLRYALALVLFPYQSSFPFSLPLRVTPMYPFFCIRSPDAAHIRCISKAVLKCNQPRRNVLRSSITSRRVSVNYVNDIKMRSSTTIRANKDEINRRLLVMRILPITPLLRLRIIMLMPFKLRNTAYFAINRAFERPA